MMKKKIPRGSNASTRLNILAIINIPVPVHTSVHVYVHVYVLECTRVPVWSILQYSSTCSSTSTRTEYSWVQCIQYLVLLPVWTSPIKSIQSNHAIMGRRAGPSSLWVAWVAIIVAMSCLSILYMDPGTRVPGTCNWIHVHTGVVLELLHVYCNCNKHGCEHGCEVMRS